MVSSNGPIRTAFSPKGENEGGDAASEISSVADPDNDELSYFVKPKVQSPLNPNTKHKCKFLASGDALLFPHGTTVNACRVDIARRHDRFAPEIRLVDCVDGCDLVMPDMILPAEVKVMFSNVKYSKHLWLETLLDHAREGDLEGVIRLKERAVGDAVYACSSPKKNHKVSTIPFQYHYSDNFFPTPKNIHSLKSYPSHNPSFSKEDVHSAAVLEKNELCLEENTSYTSCSDFVLEKERPSIRSPQHFSVQTPSNIKNNIDEEILYANEYCPSFTSSGPVPRSMHEETEEQNQDRASVEDSGDTPRSVCTGSMLSREPLHVGPRNIQRSSTIESIVSDSTAKYSIIDSRLQIKQMSHANPKINFGQAMKEVQNQEHSADDFDPSPICFVAQTPVARIAVEGSPRLAALLGDPNFATHFMNMQEARNDDVFRLQSPKKRRIKKLDSPKKDRKEPALPENPAWLWPLVLPEDKRAEIIPEKIEEEVMSSRDSEQSEISVMTESTESVTSGDDRHREIWNKRNSTSTFHTSISATSRDNDSGTCHHLRPTSKDVRNAHQLLIDQSLHQYMRSQAAFNFTNTKKEQRMLHTLIQAKGDINYIEKGDGEQLYTPLRRILDLPEEPGTMSLALLLIKYGANVNHINISGESILHSAVALNKKLFIQLLLYPPSGGKIDTDINLRRSSVVSLLTNAMTNVKFLGDEEPIPIIDEIQTSKKNRKSRIPFRKALPMTCEIDLLPKEINVWKIETINEKDLQGWSPLYTACYYGFTEIVTLLLNSIEGQNLKVDNINADGWFPLSIATYGGHAAIVEELCFHKADPNLGINDGLQGKVGHQTALNIASYKGHSHIIEILCSYGAIVNFRDEDDWEPIKLAHRAGKVEAVAVLEKYKIRQINGEIQRTREKEHGGIVTLFKGLFK